METEKPPELISIGFLRKPIGLAGWLGLTAYGQTLEEIKLPCSVFVKKPRQANPESVRLVTLQRHPKGYRVKFAEVQTFEQAEEFRNSELLIPYEQLPASGENEFYHFELEGMDAFVDRANQHLGTVVSVHNYPSVDALEIRRSDSDGVLIIPLTPEAVKEVNLDGNYLVVNSSVLEDLL